MMNHVKTTHQQECLSRFSGDWKKINFADSAKLKARIGWQGLRTSEYLQSGYAYLITGTDFHNGRIKWDTCHFVNEERYKQDLNIQIKKHDILLTKDGTIGKVAYIDPVPGPTTLNSGVFVIRPVNAGSFVPNFVYHVLNSFLFENFLAKLAAGSTINHLYQKDFVDFSFKAPSELVEQLAIADTLSDVDSLIGSLQKLIEKKKAIKLGTMQELLTGRKRLPGFCKKWLKTYLKEMVTLRKERINPVEIDNIRCIELEHIEPNSGRILGYCESKYQKSLKTVFYPNDILWGKLRPYLRKYAHPGFGGVCSTEFWVFNAVDKYVCSDFMYYLLQTEDFVSAANATAGTKMPRADWNLVKELEFDVPSDKKEQQVIAQVLSDMDSEIEQLEKKLLKYQQIKQGMMQELLTGRIRLIADGAANCEMAQDKGIGAGV